MRMEAVPRVRAILAVKLGIAREVLPMTNTCRRVLRLIRCAVLAMIDCTSYGVAVMGSMGTGLPMRDSMVAGPLGASLLWFDLLRRILVCLWRCPF